MTGVRSAMAGLLVAASMLAAGDRDAAASQEVRLDVPYVRQTKTLCGGAAAAMVFRYWGDAHAHRDEFAPLLDRAAGGLATDVLAKAIEDRGWRVIRFTGSMESVADILREGRPVIVLLKEGGGRFNYVVVVGTAGPRVFVHDPARRPSRSIPVRQFLTAWEPAQFWALLVLPAPSRQ